MGFGLAVHVTLVFQSKINNPKPKSRIPTMLSAETAISRLRRDLTLGAILKGLLVTAIVAAMVIPSVDLTAALVVIGGVWLALGLTSARGSRLAADSPALIASGQFEEAERHIEEALRTFSVFRAVKLQSLHHLAVLRHAQRRWAESALLCRALLGQRLGALQGLDKPSRLLLAEAMLEMNDLRGAHEAIGGLYTQRLSLAEVLKLLRVQLDYECRIGAWDRMTAGVMNKAQLAELMSAASAARAQALLALAAKRAGRADWHDWLRRRAELLADPEKLIAERPLLAEVWADGAGRDGVVGS